MYINILFIVFTFIIVIVVVLIADSLTTAMLIISLLANFLVICSHFNKVSKNILNISTHGLGLPTSEAPAQIEGGDGEDINLYGGEYEEHRAYQDGYSSCYKDPKPVIVMSGSEKDAGIDAANAFMAQRRARDKKCSDGWASKDVNYYKYHFGKELDEEEAKPWWGAFD